MTVSPAVLNEVGVAADEELDHAELAAQESMGRRASRRRDAAIKILSIVLLVITWEVLSLVLRYKAVVGPLDTLNAAGVELYSGELLKNLGFTLERVAEVFSLSMAAGVLLGIATGNSRTLDTLISPWITILLTLPGLVLFVICYIAFGISSDAGLIVAVTLMLTPAIMVTTIQGVRALDRRLQNMARSYGHSTVSRVTQVVLPQLAPYLFGSVRYALPLAWHMVTFAEIIGRPNGFGFQIYYHYQTADVEGVWAYSFAFVMVALILEFGVLRPLQRHFFRWRQEVQL